MSNPTFRQDVDGLTQYLQAEYELTIVEDTFELVDGWKCGHVTLANKFVRIVLLREPPEISLWMYPYRPSMQIQARPNVALMLADLPIGLVSTGSSFLKSTLMTLKSSSFPLGRWYS